MKSLRIVTLVSIALVAGLAGTGCKKKPQRVTPLPGQAASGVGSDTTSGVGAGVPAGVGPGVTPDATSIKPGPDGGFETSGRSIADRPQDRAKFQAYTVLFDYDRSVVKSKETSKVDAVVSEFKNCDPNSDLLIEGHCDERGTPEYNRALGERRALALREYVIRAGLNPERVHTISFGKDKPASLGHDEASHAKNRRGEFILVLPR